MKVFSLIFLFLLSLTACASKTVIAVNTQSPQFVITEKANPTTGYSWTVKNYDPQLLKLVSARYEGPQEQKPGTGGQMMWVFEVLPNVVQAPITTHIQLVYARPWDPSDHPTIKNYLVVIKP